MTRTPEPRSPSRGGALARERLAFNFGPGTVPGRAAIIRAADERPTFATAEYAEPRDWGYFGLLLFTCVLLFRPQDQIPGLQSFHIAEIAAAFGILPMVMHRFARRQPVFRVTPETVAMLAFGFVILATVPFSIWPGGALNVFIDSYLKVVIVFALMMNTLTSPKRIDQVTWIILLACGYIAVRTGFDYVRGINLVEGNRANGAVGGIFGNPNDLALNMVTFMPAAALIAVDRAKTPIRRIMAAGIVAAMLAAIVFTKSRGGFVGLVVMLASLIVLARKIRPGFGAMAVVALLVATPFMPHSFWVRMSSIVDEKQDEAQTGSREARRVVMEEGIHVFMERPLTGVGAGQFKNYNPPGRKERWHETHDALIQVAAETGIFGLLAFGYLIVRGGMAALWTRRRLASPGRKGAPDPVAAVMTPAERRALYTHTTAMTAGLIGWFTCSLFASVAYSWTFYYLLALIVVARELVADRLSHAHVPAPAVRKRATARRSRFAPGVATGAA